VRKSDNLPPVIPKGKTAIMIKAARTELNNAYNSAAMIARLTGMMNARRVVPIAGFHTQPPIRKGSPPANAPLRQPGLNFLNRSR